MLFFWLWKTKPPQLPLLEFSKLACILLKFPIIYHLYLWPTGVYWKAQTKTTFLFKAKPVLCFVISPRISCSFSSSFRIFCMIKDSWVLFSLTWALSSPFWTLSSSKRDFTSWTTTKQQNCHVYGRITVCTQIIYYISFKNQLFVVTFHLTSHAPNSHVIWDIINLDFMALRQWDGLYHNPWILSSAIQMINKHMCIYKYEQPKMFGKPVFAAAFQPRQLRHPWELLRGQPFSGQSYLGGGAALPFFDQAVYPDSPTPVVELQSEKIGEKGCGGERQRKPVISKVADALWEISSLLRLWDDWNARPIRELRVWAGTCHFQVSNVHNISGPAFQGRLNWVRDASQQIMLTWSFNISSSLFLLWRIFSASLSIWRWWSSLPSATWISACSFWRLQEDQNNLWSRSCSTVTLCSSIKWLSEPSTYAGPAHSYRQRRQLPRVQALEVCWGSPLLPQLLAATDHVTEVMGSGTYRR